MASRLAVLSDFDGTITMTDVAEDLLARFAPGGWEEIEKLHRARLIGTRETMARQFALVHAGREELVAYAKRTARMDPGVPAFVGSCRARGIPFEIVSEGLDFYLHALIKSWNLDVPVRTNRAVFEDGRIRIEYPFADPTCTLCGTCKLDRVFELRAAGFRVVYIGDGDSDLCPAIEADVVFAKQRLAELCDTEEIAYTPFERFSEIEKEMAAWR
jgi:2-hydroxy-3-keto-5-methylthiopentenyl-1-phosphate phosphatase